MFNTAAPCEYETDDEYRACLLAAFDLPEYSDEIVAKIDALYESPLGKSLYPAADALEQSTGLPHDMAFCLLFNFEHFKSTHAKLKE
jgi:hypothetical protein